MKKIKNILGKEKSKNKQGKLVVYSGPSGVGKGTLREYFINDPKYNFVFSVSNTTRPIRSGEKDGVDYNFISKEEFKDLISKAEMLEYAEYAGNYYGTPIKFVASEIKKGNNVFIEIETVGVEQIIKKIPEAITIFILPPSIDVLINRLKIRGTEDPATIETRLKIAKVEIKKSDSNIFKYKIINDDLEKASEKIRTILNRELR